VPTAAACERHPAAAWYLPLKFNSLFIYYSVSTAAAWCRPLLLFIYYLLLSFSFSFFYICGACSGSTWEAFCGSMMPAFIIYLFMYIILYFCILYYVYYIIRYIWSIHYNQYLQRQHARGILRPHDAGHYHFIISFMYYLVSAAAACRMRLAATWCLPY
jgi:hypothetical protein